jgi:hypothetical protein
MGLDKLLARVITTPAEIQESTEWRSNQLCPHWNADPWLEKRDLAFSICSRRSVAVWDPC